MVLFQEGRELKMSEFHKEAEHDKYFALLFDSHNIEAKFRTSSTMRYTIIKDKEERRICSMLESVGDIGAQFIQLQTSAVSSIAWANTPEEALLKQFGMIKIPPSGLAICPHCLDKAILTCEENLQVLKDLREATKSY